MSGKESSESKCCSSSGMGFEHGYVYIKRFSGLKWGIAKIYAA